MEFQHQYLGIFENILEQSEGILNRLTTEIFIKTVFAKQGSFPCDHVYFIMFNQKYS